MQQKCEDIATDARQLCPVDTGHLRENIFTRVTETSEGVIGEVYNNIKYAPYVEFGTGPVGEEAKLKIEGITLSYRPTPWVYKDENGFHYTNGMVPQPFLYPAMKQNEDDIKEKLKTAVTMELK